MQLVQHAPYLIQIAILLGSLRLQLPAVRLCNSTKATGWGRQKSGYVPAGGTPDMAAPMQVLPTSVCT